MMLVLMVTPPFLTALGVVREKENGSIYNIYASTISRSEFILGKLLPYLLISCLNILVLWWLVMKVFGTPFKGDPLFYYAGFRHLCDLYSGCRSSGIAAGKDASRRRHADAW